MHPLSAPVPLPHLLAVARGSAGGCMDAVWRCRWCRLSHLTSHHSCIHACLHGSVAGIPRPESPAVLVVLAAAWTSHTTTHPLRPRCLRLRRSRSPGPSGAAMGSPRLDSEAGWGSPDRQHQGVFNVGAHSTTVGWAVGSRCSQSVANNGGGGGGGRAGSRPDLRRLGSKLAAANSSTPGGAGGSGAARAAWAAGGAARVQVADRRRQRPAGWG